MRRVQKQSWNHMEMEVESMENWEAEHRARCCGLWYY